MRRFEFSEGTSNKFWEIGLEGESFTVVWGKIGTSGQTQTKSFPSSAAAQKEHDKLVAEKLKKGYLEVGEAPATAVIAAKPKAPAAPKAAPAPVAPPPAAPPAPVAVKPAPAPAAPTPAAGETTIVWDPELEKERLPRRGDKRAEWPKKTAEEAQKPLIEELSNEYFQNNSVADLERGLSKAEGDCRKLQASILKWLKAKKAPAKLEVEEQAAAYVLISSDVSTALQNYWLHVAGPEFALEALAATFKYQKANEWQAKGSCDWLADRVPSEEQQLLWRFEWAPLRQYLLGCDDATYARARTVAAKLRESGPLSRRVLITMSFPGETEWVREDLSAWATAVADDKFRSVVVYAPGALLHGATPELVPAVMIFFKALHAAHKSDHGRWARNATVYFNDFLALAGPAAEEPMLFVADVLSGEDPDENLVKSLSQLKSPRTARFFAHQVNEKKWRPAVLDYCRSAPRLGAAALAEVAAGKGAVADAAKTSLVGLIGIAGDLDSLLPTLSPGARAVIESLRTRADVKDADEKQLPALLATPPWTTKQKPVPPVVVKDVKTLEREEKLAFTPAEQKLAEKKAETIKKTRDKEAEQKLLEELGEEDRSVYLSWHFDGMPAPSVLHVFEVGTFERITTYNSFARGLLARIGPPVIPGLMKLAPKLFGEVFDAMRVADSTRTATLAIDAMGKGKALTKQAQEWLLKFPETAATGIIPIAVGETGKRRNFAEGALRLIAQKGHKEAIQSVAKKYGKEVEAAVQAVLSFDPLMAFPAKLPKMPAFWKPESFSRPLLKDRKSALPVKAVEALGAMLAFSLPDNPYVGLAQVKEACDPGSLADFAWDLFQAWLLEGAPSKENWAFFALGHLGGDEAARKLTALIRVWPGEGGNARAVTGLDVLALIGTDVALMNLHGIAQKVKFKNLQEKARQKIDEIAEARGLSADELADRLVPDLGLDDDGSLTLDFGARQFRVSFDESLKPIVLDTSGKAISDLPKPNKSDDAEKSAAASETWKAMKKDAKTIASGQVLRFELAMCSERKWMQDVFKTFLLDHPLMIHLVRRVVWGAFDAEEKLVGTFRVAEDKSLANDKDDAYTLPKDATVGILHRLNMTDAQVTTWGQIFSDYKILQPFDQLGRQIYTPTAAEKKASSLDRMNGVKVPTGKVLGLELRGWRRGIPQDAGWVWDMSKRLGDGYELTLGLDGGLCMGMMSESPSEQGLSGPSIESTEDSEKKATFGDLSPIAFSELVLELERLRA